MEGFAALNSRDQLLLYHASNYLYIYIYTYTYVIEFPVLFNLFWILLASSFCMEPFWLWRRDKFFSNLALEIQGLHFEWRPPTLDGTLKNCYFWVQKRGGGGCISFERYCFHLQEKIQVLFYLLTRFALEAEFLGIFFSALRWTSFSRRAAGCASILKVTGPHREGLP